MEVCLYGDYSSREMGFDESGFVSRWNIPKKVPFSRKR
jgi:hypothetical protein